MTFLSASKIKQYARFSAEERLRIAKSAGCTPSWARLVLRGSEKCTGTKASRVVEEAEKQLSR